MRKIRITHHLCKKSFPIWDFRFWSTLIIRMKTNSNYYHTAIQIGDELYEALFFEGVVKRLVKTKFVSDKMISFHVPECKELYDFKAYMDKQVGKKYDFLSVIFGFFGKKADDKRRWFCSELNSVFFWFFCPKINLETNISPKDIYMLSQGLICRNTPILDGVIFDPESQN